MKKHFYIFAAITLLLINGAVNEANACAAGCGTMNVGTSSLIPNKSGGLAFVQYDYMSQSRNWNKEKQTSEHNHDYRIRTQTVTLGTQYMFNRKWGAAIRMPYVMRYVDTMATADMMDGMKRVHNGDVGDIRLNAIYSGFFDDMSTGVTLGLKLPTGQTNAKGIERNQQIGSGSYDLIVGAYHRGNFGSSNFGYFAQTSAEQPLLRHRGYTPGSEISASIGTYYNAGQFGSLKKVAPILQFIGSKKTQDSGWATADHNSRSGYSQIYFAPGIEVNVGDYKIYADIELPIYRNANGPQLVTQNMYKMIVGYNF